MELEVVSTIAYFIEMAIITLAFFAIVGACMGTIAVAISWGCDKYDDWETRRRHEKTMREDPTIRVYWGTSVDGEKEEGVKEIWHESK